MSFSEYELEELSKQSGISQEKLKESVGEDGKIDGAKLEKSLIEEAQQQRQVSDPVEMASTMITLYTPAFKQRIFQLSSRQLRRVAMSLVEYPLGKDYAHKGIEAETVAIGRNLLDAKAVLMFDTYSKNAELIQKQAEELKNNNNGENNEPTETT